MCYTPDVRDTARIVVSHDVELKFRILCIAHTILRLAFISNVRKHMAQCNGPPRYISSSDLVDILLNKKELLLS